ncbi:MAG: HPr family phosphocarrier protein [Mariprofundaceae bacterium]|nr:HPr family phosphocarrier protein [Mariprofundaceae bacterium]
MAEQTITIRNKLGLHARASARLAVTASAYDCDVFISKDGVEVNGKSIMGIMMLAAGKSSQVTVRTKGDQEDAALTAIVQLVNECFGETE